MMEFLGLQTGELVTVVVLSLAVIAVAVLGRRAQQQAPAPPGETAADARPGNDTVKHRSR